MGAVTQVHKPLSIMKVKSLDCHTRLSEGFSFTASVIDNSLRTELYCVHVSNTELESLCLAGERHLCPCTIGGSVGRASACYAVCHGFESRLRQLIFP